MMTLKTLISNIFRTKYKFNSLGLSIQDKQFKNGDPNMAKIRRGDLVLSSTETIIKDGIVVVDNTRKGIFSSLDLDSTGATINEFSIDTTLAGNSDTALPTEKAVKAYVDTGLSGLSQNKISQLNSKVEVIDTGTGYVDIIVDTKQAAKFNALATELYYNGTKKFETSINGVQVDGDLSVTGNTTITGNLTVDGTSFTANTVTVLIEDNLLVINKNETGAGVTAGVAGIEVERGSVTNYQFLFDETQDNFRIGMAGSLQAVATREDTPTSGGVATWNNTAKRFDTAAVGTAFNKSYGTTAGTTCQGNDSRLSDARTPISHNNTYHSATYIVAADVNYTNLNNNSSVGTGATQVAQGNHTHSYLPLTGGTLTGGLAITVAGNSSIEIGRVDGVSSTPFIDFHSGATATDYDSRIIASGGTGTASGGTLQIQATTLLLTGAVSITGATKNDAYLYAGTSDPTNATRLNYDGYFYATRVYNAVWNDVADFQKIVGEQIPGKCYYGTLNGAKICSSQCQKAVIGILSDTYGIAAGYQFDSSYGPIAIAGWVLAYVDDICEPGDVLTNGSNGNLVKITREEKLEYPERIVAIYGRPEPSKVWGTDSVQVQVNERHWVQVK